MIRNRKKKTQEQAGKVLLEGTPLENVFCFTYLGSDFQADGEQKQAVKVRMAMAKTVFGQLMNIWESDLATPKKLYLYSAAVVSILVYGFESWNLSDSILSTLKGRNARCLARITGKSIPEESRDPTFKLINILKARRLKWVQKEMERFKENSTDGTEQRWAAQAIIARAEKMMDSGGYKQGFALEDAPKHDTVVQLLQASKGKWVDAFQKLESG